MAVFGCPQKSVKARESAKAFALANGCMPPSPMRPPTAHRADAQEFAIRTASKERWQVWMQSLILRVLHFKPDSG